ncbi:hypothetical protein Cgig2_027593 [Carnegiea gigantea]|uniref:Uncharacterized protein n=1 Tax=Carnegiea gigantea TaxID=171969 RepID=A0A9Q1QCU1_9CARY|nr:hypothetical protein Cgig2_027593 [Carnegiea gigantea]
MKYINGKLVVGNYNISNHDFTANESKPELSCFDCEPIAHKSTTGLLHEMLGMAKQWNSQSTWKVLIMDRFTVKIMSYTCKMADIIEAGVSSSAHLYDECDAEVIKGVVEDIYKRRQPLPNMDAIYFLQPTKENVIMFMSDMAGKSPLYKKAFVFFSSPISGELLDYIKKDATVLPRLGVLSEMNLEYFAIDSQGEDSEA